MDISTFESPQISTFASGDSGGDFDQKGYGNDMYRAPNGGFLIPSSADDGVIHVTPDGELN